MDLNMEQMEELIELFEDSELTEISVSQDDSEVTLKKESGGASSGSRADTLPRRAVKPDEEEIDVEGEEEDSGSGEKEASEDEEGVFVTSPIVGTFYRSPSPDDPSYVQVGDVVEEGDTVCIVEAMKVMNEVKADAGGEVVEIHPEDGDPVEYGQKLMTLIPPDGEQ
ncbi:acetyl-CoA carboxylase biotin carboxyl carrier protein [Candidatus Bipolaricaulota bacterium]|nr:acetyl-CoA carboxylase biotin carboxyl carrier protein [Candidatus Bipolaricaulota bacterium]